MRIITGLNTTYSEIEHERILTLMDNPSAVPKLDEALDTLEKTISILSDIVPNSNDGNVNARDIDLFPLLSTRAFHALFRNGVKSLKDLNSLTKDQVLEFRGVGQVVFNEICDVMNDHGVKFKE